MKHFLTGLYILHLNPEKGIQIGISSCLASDGLCTNAKWTILQFCLLSADLIKRNIVEHFLAHNRQSINVSVNLFQILSGILLVERFWKLAAMEGAASKARKVVCTTKNKAIKRFSIRSVLLPIIEIRTKCHVAFESAETTGPRYHSDSSNRILER